MYREDISADNARIRMILIDIERDVQEDGWALVDDTADIVDEDNSGFTYTIGLHKRGLPELIAHGLCHCPDMVIETLALRQLRVCAYEDDQITQVCGVSLQLRRWPYTAHLPLLNAFYRRSVGAGLVLQGRISRWGE